MDKENTHIGPSGAKWDGLERIAMRGLAPGAISSYCEQNGLDEKEAWVHLSEVDPDEEVRARLSAHASTYIRAKDIIDQGEIPGIAPDQVRQLFRILAEIGSDVRGAHFGRIPFDEISHIQHRGIAPAMFDGCLEILGRLSSHVLDAIPWDRWGFVEAKETPDSIRLSISRERQIEAWLREHQPGVALEIAPGRYGSVDCAVILDETDNLDAWIHPPVKMARPEPPGPEIYPGIAVGFARWYDTDDATLSYIVREHRLPPGHNRVSYRGRNKADAVRFWESISMTPQQWNDCFCTRDGKPIRSNAKPSKGLDGKPIQIDQDKNSGIYIPLKTFGLLK